MNVLDELSASELLEQLSPEQQEEFHRLIKQPTAVDDLLGDIPKLLEEPWWLSVQLPDELLEQVIRFDRLVPNLRTAAQPRSLLTWNIVATM
jgi:hypothetical protein